MNNLKKFDFDGVNKLLVTGFHESNNFSVSSLLDKNGITFAKPSKNENMDASEISELILKTQKKSTSPQVSNISPIWNSLALDLFLGNIDQEFWCWNDSKALELLEYWKNLDHQIAFILVYNSPEQIIADLLNNETLESLDEIDDVLEKWTEYNEKLLHFYYRNKEKSLLIHAGQIDENQADYLEVLHKKVGIEFKGFNFAEEIEHQLDTTEVLEKSKEQVTSTQSFLISQIVSENYQAQKIYEELQSVANVFYNTKNLPNSKKALYDFLLLKQNYEKEHKHEEEKVKKLQLDLEASTKDMQKVQKEKESLKKELLTENELLLTQLHHVQEELEKYYLENTKDETKVLTLEKEYKQKQEKVKKLQLALEASTRDMQKVQKEKESLKKELLTENELLLIQLHQVQEELEKYYLENQKLKEIKQELKRYYGAADRIKEQLSYRLGAKMIEKSHSLVGILDLPFSLMSVHSEYKKDMKAKKGEKLPPIESYADAYDAQRIKNHLSYMLGQTMIKTLKNPFGIFVLPFRLQATHKLYKKQREV